MIYYLIKTLLTAIVIVIVSEVAKKSSLLAAIIVSLPLTSLLAFIWLFWSTKDVNKVIDLSYNTILMVIPSFVFFFVLPMLLKLKIHFSISLIISIICTSLAYYIFIYFLSKYGIKI